MKKKSAKKKVTKKVVKKTEPKSKPAELSAEQDLLEDIKILEKKTSVAEKEWEAAKLAAKMAREEFDESVSKLRSLISQGHEPLPLFDGIEEEKGEKGDDPRLQFPIDKLDLPQDIFVAFDRSKIKTIGDLVGADGKITFMLTGMIGIGQAKAIEIEKAVEEFWKKYPEK